MIFGNLKEIEVDNGVTTVNVLKLFDFLIAKKLEKLLLRSDDRSIKKQFFESITTQCPNIKILTVIAPHLVREHCFEIAINAKQVSEFRYLLGGSIHCYMTVTFNTMLLRVLNDIGRFLNAKNLKYVEVNYNSSFHLSCRQGCSKCYECFQFQLKRFRPSVPLGKLFL